MRRNNEAATLIIAILSLATSLCASAQTTSARGPSTQPESRRPNIVFVISDDHRWDCLGTAGNRAIVTPALDRMAREGVWYRQATSHVPQCCPSRATLLTGLTAHQHGWFSNQTQAQTLKDGRGFGDLPLLPGLLQQAGYSTLLVGKWHLAPEVVPWNCGFTDVRLWMPAGGGPYLDAPRLARGKSLDPIKGDGFTNELFGDIAIEFLGGDAAKRTPFFLWLALTAPHTPLRPNPPEIEKLYQGIADRDLWPPALPADARPNDLKAYCEAVSMADRQLGRVLEALDRQKLADNTIVIFLGDNGLMMGSRDVGEGQGRNFQGKVFPYEGSIRVPLLIRGPGIGAGRVSDDPVSSIDLPPTILKLANVAPPAAWPGRDLRQGDPKPGEAYCEFADAANERFGNIEYRLVRTETHKLIVWQRDDKPPELYDLVNDAYELKNLIDDRNAKPTVDDLARLSQWIERTDDPARDWPRVRKQRDTEMNRGGEKPRLNQ